MRVFSWYTDMSQNTHWRTDKHLICETTEALLSMQQQRQDV